MVSQLESKEPGNLSVDIRDRVEIELCQEGCECPEHDVGQDDVGGLLPSDLPQDGLTPEDHVTLAHVDTFPHHQLALVVDLNCHHIAHQIVKYFFYVT